MHVKGTLRKIIDYFNKQQKIKKLYIPKTTCVQKCKINNKGKPNQRIHALKEK